MNGEHVEPKYDTTEDPVSTPGVRNPTHRCKICGALWIWFPHWPGSNPGSWSLYSPQCGKCCDNAPMGEQIEQLGKVFLEMRERAIFRADRHDPCTWVLLLLLNEEISTAKAREWLRHYIRDGREDLLPTVESLP